MYKQEPLETEGRLNIALPMNRMQTYRIIRGIHVGLDKEAVRRMFPNLARELETDENRVAINSVRTDVPTGEEATSRDFVHYTPDVIDFIRRCDTEQQAEEIVAYMERRGEIEKEYADRIREQLKEKGVRSFGTKKENDYYLKHGEL